MSGHSKWSTIKRKKGAADQKRSENAELQRIPVETKTIDAETGIKVLKIIEIFEDDDDVQNVFHNLEITDEMIEKMD